jgi:signal transduction histidine kinase
VLLDVTERFRVQRQLAEQRARELAYLDHLPVGVWFVGADGRIEYGNRAGREIWAGARYVKPEEFGQYRGWWHATGQPIAADEWAAARAIQRGETSLNEEIDIACFDGITRRTIVNSAVPVRDADGRVAGAVILNQDITDRLRSEAALRDADRRKDEFIATLGHELRNPLAPLRNGVELLRIAGADPDTRQRIVGIMDRQLAHMVRLVDDLLEVSRITRGKIELRRVHADLRQIIAGAVETVAETVKASGNELSMRMPDAPLMVDVDPVRITQVVTNLLDNAAKYTQRGRITLSAWPQERMAVFEVRDNGAGIPVEMLERVFEIFTQVDRTLARSQAGLGIGLALVRRLVEMHGGRVSAASDGVGTGAAFRVELPLLAG